MKTKILPFLIFIIIISGLQDNFVIAESKYKSAVDRLKAENKQRVQDLRKELKQIQQEIKDKHYKFKVGITEAFKFKISEINGDKKLKKEPTPEENKKEKKKYEIEIKKLKKIEAPVVVPEKKPEKKEEPEPVKPKPVVVAPETEEYECGCKPEMKKWDWRDKGVVTDIQYQGQCGCCWAFAAVAALESNFIIHYNEKHDFSEQYFVNCIKNGCNGGNSLNVFKYLKTHSIPFESDLPYAGKEQRCKRIKSSPYYTVATGYVGSYRDYIDPGLKKIKQAVCKYGPIVVSMRSTRAFHAYKGGIYDEVAPGNTNHAILIVGWDDSKNSYIVKNSWGKDWGENGYVYMDYKTNTAKYARWVLVKKK